MKQQLVVLLAILVAAVAGYAIYQRMQAPQSVARQGETKYICSIGGPDEVYTTEFATKEECKKNCKGASVVCEETSVKTPVVDIVD